jgi:hypothetical protein
MKSERKIINLTIGLFLGVTVISYFVTLIVRGMGYSDKLLLSGELQLPIILQLCISGLVYAIQTIAIVSYSLNKYTIKIVIIAIGYAIVAQC